MSGEALSLSESVPSQQFAFLLHQFRSAPEGILSQSDANSAIPTQIKGELKLGPKPANSLRGSMITSGWLTAEKLGKNLIYSITDAGKQQLRDLERYVPLAPAKGKLNQPADDQMRTTREVYILTALSKAPARTISKSDLEVGFGGKGKPKVAELASKHPHLAMFRDQHCLGLNPATTRAVLTELAVRGDISVHRADGSESYALTPAGVELLDKLRSQCPVFPPTGKPSPTANESLRHAREAYLLFRLFQSAQQTLWESDVHASNKKEPLKLNHATSWQVRGELARAGHIALNWDGKEGSYTLTPSGKRYLTTLPFDELGEMKIKGSVLTELLTAAREGTKSPAGMSSSPSLEPKAPKTALTETQLEDAVMGTFHELLAGPYANLRMVPIHEMRKVVAERFGVEAASHAVFNECMLALRRAKQLRLISIDDRSRATPEQLRDSVFAVGETFFYAEKAHAAV